MMLTFLDDSSAYYALSISKDSKSITVASYSILNGLELFVFRDVADSKHPKAVDIYYINRDDIPYYALLDSEVIHNLIHIALQSKHAVDTKLIKEAVREVHALFRC